MKIMYKCRCTDAERSVEVPERPKNGDLVLWVQHVVGGVILVDHDAHSPNCRATVMEYVKIPVDEHAGGIGMKPVLAS